MRVQVQPGGFAMHVLPYTDEVRIVAPSCPCIPAVCQPALDPPSDPPSLPAPSRRPPEAAVAAAAAMIDAMTDPDMTRFQFESPEVSFATAVLRSQVLNEEPPDRAGFNGVRAYLAKRVKENPVPLRVKEAFLEQVWQPPRCRCEDVHVC